MAKLRKLTYDEWVKLDVQYSRTPGLSNGWSNSGEHYLLVSILNELGFYPHSREEAMELAERLLFNGYEKP